MNTKKKVLTDPILKKGHVHKDKKGCQHKNKEAVPEDDGDHSGWIQCKDCGQIVGRPW